MSSRPHSRTPSHATSTSHHSPSCIDHQLPELSNVYIVNSTIRTRSSKNTNASRIAHDPIIQGANLRRLSLPLCFGPTLRTSQASELQNCGRYTCFLGISQSTSDPDHPPVPVITSLIFRRCVPTNLSGRDNLTSLLMCLTAS